MELRWPGFLLALAVALAANAGTAQPDNEPTPMENLMKIRIIIGSTALNATLEDNSASRDFSALLPLDLTLSDYHGTEKIADLPARLSTEGMPAGIDPEIGDITYFAPWGNLALFYRDFGYSRGLIRLGRIEGNINHLAGDGELNVRIERAGESD